MLYIPHESGRILTVGGRRLPKPGAHHGISLARHLQQASYPPSVSYQNLSQTALAEMYLNDSLGDCVIAGGYHALGLWTGNSDGGAPFLASSSQILSDYEAIGGYVPGHPDTDNGCDEPTAFQYWMGLGSGKGFADGSYLAGYASLDGTNQSQVSQALFTFESVTFGVGLPDEWVSGIGSLKPGFTWDVAGPSNPSSGHDFIGLGYTPNGVLICTWGMVGLLTWAAVAKYTQASDGNQLYALLSAEQILKGQSLSPGGVNWPGLLADLQELPGEIVNRTSAPAPVPPKPAPAPVPPKPAPAPVPPKPAPAPAPPRPFIPHPKKS